MAEVNGSARRAQGDAGRLIAHPGKQLDEETQTAWDTAEGRSAVPCASPWSGLHWLPEDETLERILFPVD